ncbi:thiol peroxidase (atypical 2-Cys peroxiredoxin) [Sulfurimonas denitrificans DSM 1251]|uniref:Thiol peroxidase (Atypical 2-Cys peroxiredoxin) n=1 Tax=Sulfurimonas denitrificans (strain ATCC 33889 / DSM 1251) TaxID=326298 RepID=Q30UB8_SULDN|nr:thiol peroxidase [Sulfurimonas denitrificans]ABB43413.1 thiol peroxidase (atypical 2-Cys peroxiredoxin) [Sulfurimonas denitrificans DSM 1251]
MATTKFKGTDVQLLGNQVNVGDKAPQITVVNSDGLGDVVVGGAQGHKQLIIVVPSLDTGVCATETRNFNAKASSLNGVKPVIVSLDLPFAAGRFCSTEGITNLTVTSDFRNKEFANAYGVLLGGSVLAGVTCRAIFAVNEEGIVTYKEIVPEITEEPNYDAALAAVK